ncbi:anti-sigma regulatory factor (Ser/Thr protein kinase) [Kineococcus xinjiangensis]|uniref:Anti-sigma regulatory factor (Ser/Thr protein kinase) n=1 Tax=Kineococcus xinjiangensis TaxID=512762 RepID=A0A2S6IEK6_9ACTN|nr:ATP-binding protein [Kineococcus xinjiangensis]PPK92654.1 anti-sigma regulatory factor (Ser/Thr protein kinase) [Kineococcus xinjiangensis]
MTRLTIDGKPSDVPRARRWVVRTCRQCGTCEVDTDLAELLTSEVVGNAVRHGQGPVRLDVECRSGTVRISVTDAGSDAPLPRHVDYDATSGRGLALLQALAHTWGHTPTPPPDHGKSVWFELRAD